MRGYETGYNKVHKTCANSVNSYFFTCAMYVKLKSRHFSNYVLVRRGLNVYKAVTYIVVCV